MRRGVRRGGKRGGRKEGGGKEEGRKEERRREGGGKEEGRKEGRKEEEGARSFRFNKQATHTPLVSCPYSSPGGIKTLSSSLFTKLVPFLPRTLLRGAKAFLGPGLVKANFLNSGCSSFISTT